MSNCYSQLEYSTGECQAFHLNVLVVFNSLFPIVWKSSFKRELACTFYIKDDAVYSFIYLGLHIL